MSDPISAALGLSIFVAILVIIFFVAIPILVIVFWVYMLIDCAKRKFKKADDKIVWIIIIALLQWVGALIYYFVIKRKKGGKK